MENFFQYFYDKYKVNLRNLDSECLLDKLFCIGGQEGIDFLDEFLIHFNISVDTIEYIEHFTPDSFGFSLKKFIPLDSKPLKLKHLINAYRKGYWEYFS